ncbi:hypothetical protein [Variovorax saccharolyticus]|uniref:hypothetical protein n=1 Tax=Variovorax saccharolyticus TaxID=3053516 RepID=UPI002576AAF6|nr:MULTISPECIES: hypothetical protein [unclassified Variovorax]MDM0020661.1 hypothetical protein [Variovorax sp. J22R187]MDM0025780.1 hypothetical protein [Variovorax sp. J31P216]
MKSILRSTSSVLLAGVAMLGAAVAQAQGSNMPNCEDPRVDRTACYREAAAAQEAKRQGLLNSPGGYDKNALARCQRQPESARAACEQRVLGTGNTTIRGSVQGGGKIRTTEVPVPAKN